MMTVAALKELVDRILEEGHDPLGEVTVSVPIGGERNPHRRLFAGLAGDWTDFASGVTLLCEFEEDNMDGARPAYEILEPGELVEHGDQWWRADGQWPKCKNIGEAVQKGQVVRRPVRLG